jgi:hypothetical protein
MPWEHRPGAVLWLVGKLVRPTVLVVRVGRVLVHPTYNPQVPWGDLARRLNG